MTNAKKKKKKLHLYINFTLPQFRKVSRNILRTFLIALLPVLQRPLLVAQTLKKVKNLPAMQETQVWSLGQEDPLEKGMATHSSTLAWRILWTGGAWQASVHGVSKSWTPLTLSLLLFKACRKIIYCISNKKILRRMKLSQWLMLLNTIYTPEPQNENNPQLSTILGVLIFLSKYLEKSHTEILIVFWLLPPLIWKGNKLHSKKSAVHAYLIHRNHEKTVK